MAQLIPITQGQVPVPTNTPAQPTSTDTKYSSCDGTHAAAQMRVQGTKGNGKGFLKWMVPSTKMAMVWCAKGNRWSRP